VKVTESSQNYNLAVYSNRKINEPLPDSEFELKLPPGVKKVARKL
jgi:outer membrane lipoprotein-sorting protein